MVYPDNDIWPIQTLVMRWNDLLNQLSLTETLSWYNHCTDMISNYVCSRTLKFLERDPTLKYLTWLIFTIAKLSRYQNKVNISLQKNNSIQHSPEDHLHIYKRFTSKASHIRKYPYMTRKDDKQQRSQATDFWIKLFTRTKLTCHFVSYIIRYTCWNSLKRSY